MLSVLNVLVLATALAQQTDTTFAVRPDMRLEVENMNGQVRIVAWNRQEVRVRAQHRGEGRLDIREADAVLRVNSRRQHGLPHADIEVTVPRAMQVSVSGLNAGIRVEGTSAPVNASTVNGDIAVRGGSNVRVEAVQGSVTVENATGSVNAHSVNSSVHVRGVSGALRAETINGSVVLENIQSSDVRGSTVNGRVSYAGAIRDGGRYGFVSHAGELVVAVPEGANVTITLATISGHFSSDLPVQVTETRPGRRVSITLGTGSAQLDLESFSGSVRLTGAGVR